MGEKEEEGGGEFKERKDKKKVDCFLDEQGSTVVHEKEKQTHSLAPGQTNQHTKAEARIGN